MLAKILWVIQQIFVVRATIYDDGKHTMRVDASTQCVDDQLSNGDENAANALVT